MGRINSLQILFGLGLLIARAAVHQAAQAAAPADNLTETADEAEFRQGGIGQQLMSSYPMMGGLYGSNAAGYGQYMAAASGANGGGSYVNMLRNLYRPPSMGLTDKVKHWVKSFMNRRQYVKPYYSPSMSNLQYSADEFGAKPVYMGANGYKAISVPLRQLQKYYKPYYASGDAAGSQLMQSPPRGSAAAASLMSYSPSGAASSGLYASEAANAAHFSSGNSGLFSTGSDGNTAALFANGASSGGNLFSTGNNPSSNLFSGSQNSGLYTSGAGSSGNLFSSNEGASSALFSAATLSGGNLYGSAGSPGSGLYHASNGGAGSSVYSMDGGNSGLYGSEAGGSSGGSNSFYSSSSGSAGSGIHASLNSGSSSGTYGGDLYASGASPSATIFNPNSGDQGRGYGASGNKKPSFGGASSSTLYMSSDQRNSESYSGKSQEPINSFNVESSGNRHQAEPSYSVSFQPAQGKSYSASSFDNSGFQPVSFSSEEGYKGGSFQGKSS